MKKLHIRAVAAAFVIATGIAAIMEVFGESERTLYVSRITGAGKVRNLLSLNLPVAGKYVLRENVSVESNAFSTFLNLDQNRSLEDNWRLVGTWVKTPILRASTLRPSLDPREVYPVSGHSQSEILEFLKFISHDRPVFMSELQRYFLALDQDAEWRTSFSDDLRVKFSNWAERNTSTINRHAPETPSPR